MEEKKELLSLDKGELEALFAELGSRVIARHSFFYSCIGVFHPRR